MGIAGSWLVGMVYFYMAFSGIIRKHGAISSAGRAPALQAGCRQFKSVIAQSGFYSFSPS